MKCAYDTTMNTLNDNRQFLDVLADTLVEKETIDFNEMLQMREKYAAAKQIEPLIEALASQASSIVSGSPSSRR